MKIKTFNISPTEAFTDITNLVESFIPCNAMEDGLCLVYSKHTTACVGLIEPETLLKQDMRDFMERLASSNGLYRHDDIEKRDVPPEERRNGYSHLRAMLMNHQVIVPIIDGKLDLGKWQRIFYVEHDLGKGDRTFSVAIL